MQGVDGAPGRKERPRRLGIVRTIRGKRMALIFMISSPAKPGRVSTYAVTGTRQYAGGGA